MHATLPLLEDSDFPSLQRETLQTLQVNLGPKCNLACLHCHVNAGPHRREEMSAETADEVLRFLGTGRVGTLDLTGGAPELNPHFRRLVAGARRLDIRVIDRCNLTILEEPGQHDLAAFLAAHQVQVVASLPCYLEDNVNAQRGKGVFRSSIRGLQALNALGYGVGSGGLTLDLVFNPQGPELPPPQVELEAAYRQHLREHFDVEFTRLLTIANMPIKRFGSVLISRGQFHGYMRLLKGAHRIENLDGVMCRNLISVDWQGHLYDCDFNQMLGIPARFDDARPRSHIRDLAQLQTCGATISTADHCYGCTAGQGSSCGGALAP